MPIPVPPLHPHECCEPEEQGEEDYGHDDRPCPVPSCNGPVVQVPGFYPQHGDGDEYACHQSDDLPGHQHHSGGKDDGIEDQNDPGYHGRRDDGGSDGDTGDNLCCAPVERQRRREPEKHCHQRVNGV